MHKPGNYFPRSSWQWIRSLWMHTTFKINYYKSIQFLSIWFCPRYSQQSYMADRDVDPGRIWVNNSFPNHHFLCYFSPLKASFYEKWRISHFFWKYLEGMGLRAELRCSPENRPYLSSSSTGQRPGAVLNEDSCHFLSEDSLLTSQAT